MLTENTEEPGMTYINPDIENHSPPYKPEMVNHPKHYNEHPSGVECIQIVQHMNFCLGNAMKYIWRADEKGKALEDLEKAIFYINREIERRNGESKKEGVREPERGECAASSTATLTPGQYKSDLEAGRISHTFEPYSTEAYHEKRRVQDAEHIVQHDQVSKDNQREGGS